LTARPPLSANAVSELPAPTCASPREELIGTPAAAAASANSWVLANTMPLMSPPVKLAVPGAKRSTSPCAPPEAAAQAPTPFSVVTFFDGSWAIHSFPPSGHTSPRRSRRRRRASATPVARHRDRTERGSRCRNRRPCTDPAPERRSRLRCRRSRINFTGPAGVAVRASDARSWRGPNGGEAACRTVHVVRGRSVWRLSRRTAAGRRAEEWCA
jgi:hypothetical protein